MNRLLLAALVAAGVAGSTSAIALERSAHTTVTLQNGVIVSSSQAKFDPATGSFTRAGTATLPNGASLNFAVSGVCSMEDLACSFAGTASGPLGGDWHFEGGLVRSAELMELQADVTAPNGRFFRIERTSSGDLPEIDAFLKP